MPDFSDAKVGDVIWDNWVGEYETIQFVFHDYIKLLDGEAIRKNGTNLIVQNCNAPPRYYWDKPEISDPPRPKNKIKVIRWINIYKDGSLFCRYLPGTYTYDSKYDAINMAETINKETYIGAIPIEFEVEE